MPQSGPRAQGGCKVLACDDTDVVPLPVILVEFLVAFGLALFGANSMAFVRLRREGNWPPEGPPPQPSRTRILVGMAVGLLVTLWAVATFVSEGYSL